MKTYCVLAHPVNIGHPSTHLQHNDPARQEIPDMVAMSSVFYCTHVKAPPWWVALLHQSRILDPQPHLHIRGHSLSPSWEWWFRSAGTRTEEHQPPQLLSIPWLYSMILVLSIQRKYTLFPRTMLGPCRRWDLGAQYALVCPAPHSNHIQRSYRPIC
jgi:hypothetical protein